MSNVPCTLKEPPGENRCPSTTIYMVVLAYALSFGPAHCLATRTGILRGEAWKGAIYDFVFFPHIWLAMNYPPYMSYVQSWESLGRQ